jgi:hypothetical protein
LSSSLCAKRNKLLEERLYMKGRLVRFAPISSHGQDKPAGRILTNEDTKAF